MIFRSHGKVHFLRISSRLQIGATAAVGAIAISWLAIAGNMTWQHFALAQDQAVVEARARSVAMEARKVDAYKQSVSDIAADLDRRQDLLDDMVRSQFGATIDPGVVGAPDEGTQGEKAQGGKPQGAANSKISAASGADLPSLRAMEERQTRFAQRLATLVNQRAQKVEAAIRSFGLKPEQIASRAGSAAQGGPYIPWNAQSVADDDALTSLASALSRLNMLERGLIAIPSGRPTASPMLSSSYGYRSDPFNGHAAFHAGLDFPGRYGQPILAAASGRVSYVGQRQGYGNVVEVDHGHGIMTRYAHLSGFSARTGQDVARGTPIARMGSTGRSTGTHLHFEVRVNGAPINPRRFLEVKDDVLQTQQIAKQRFSRVAVRKGREAGKRG
ncbi:MAG: M23 family metallopeptidase [Sphingobium sp.]